MQIELPVQLGKGGERSCDLQFCPRRSSQAPTLLASWKAKAYHRALSRCFTNEFVLSCLNQALNMQKQPVDNNGVHLSWSSMISCWEILVQLGVLSLTSVVLSAVAWWTAFAGKSVELVYDVCALSMRSASYSVWNRGVVHLCYFCTYQLICYKCISRFVFATRLSDQVYILGSHIWNAWAMWEKLKQDSHLTTQTASTGHKYHKDCDPIMKQVLLPPGEAIIDGPAARLITQVTIINYWQCSM